MTLAFMPPQGGMWGSKDREETLFPYFSDSLQIIYFFIILDCFQEDGGSVKEEITEFFEKWEAVQHCFLNNSRIHLIPVPTNGSYHNISGLQSVCDDCRNSYSYLEESYKKIARSDTEEFKVCADVSASMNYTRQRWSNTFHCVKIQNDLVSVVALTVFFCFLPVIFYSAVRLQGTSNDRKTKNMRATLT